MLRKIVVIYAYSETNEKGTNHGANHNVLVHTYLFLSSSLAYNDNIHISIPADLCSNFLMLWIHDRKETTNTGTLFNDLLSL